MTEGWFIGLVTIIVGAGCAAFGPGLAIRHPTAPRAFGIGAGLGAIGVLMLSAAIAGTWIGSTGLAAVLSVSTGMCVAMSLPAGAISRRRLGLALTYLAPAAFLFAAGAYLDWLRSLGGGDAGLDLADAVAFTTLTPAIADTTAMNAGVMLGGALALLAGITGYPASRTQTLAATLVVATAYTACGASVVSAAAALGAALGWAAGAARPRIALAAVAVTIALTMFI